MKIISDVIRFGTIAVTFYAFYTGRTGDALVVLVIILGTYIFKLRHRILIEASRAADQWELSLTLLFAINALFVLRSFYYDRYLAFIDIPMHFIGGVIAGWWAYLVLAKKDGELMIDWKRALIFIVGAATLFGLGWEMFEWALDHTVGIWYTTQKAQPSLNDTMADLTLDLFGGLVISITLLRFRKKETINLLKKEI